MGVLMDNCKNILTSKDSCSTQFENIVPEWPLALEL